MNQQWHAMWNHLRPYIYRLIEKSVAISKVLRKISQKIELVYTKFK